MKYLSVFSIEKSKHYTKEREYVYGFRLDQCRRIFIQSPFDTGTISNSLVMQH